MKHITTKYELFLKRVGKFIDLLFSTRFKSFYWRTSMMALATLLTMITNSLTEAGITGQTAVVLGLILGELSKFLNNKYGNIK